MTRLLSLLARQTALQARYDRLPWAIPAYLVACLLLVPVASHLTLGSGSRAALETGLLLQWWIGCAAGGWLGLRTIGLDLDRRTAAVVLSGPVDPAIWVLGRFSAPPAVSPPWWSDYSWPGSPSPCGGAFRSGPSWRRGR